MAAPAVVDDGVRERLVAGEPGQGYELSGKIMLSAIVILFAVVVFMVGLHLYARWYLVRLRRRQLERRRGRRGAARAHVVMYADSILPSAADRGLEPAVLSSLPVFLHTAAADPAAPTPECAVCLSEFEEKEIVRLLPKCGHSFHIECIDMWFRSHSTCPLCRSPVEKVAGKAVQPLEPVEEGNPELEPGSSSGACPHTCGGTCQEKGVRIEVPVRRPEAALELTQASPASRLAYFKRILSMGRRSPSAAASSSGGGELDLESGIGESNRGMGGVETPR